VVLEPARAAGTCRRAGEARGTLFPRQSAPKKRRASPGSVTVTEMALARRAELCGYGGSSGAPTEAGLVSDALAAYAFHTGTLPGRAASCLGRIARLRSCGRARVANAAAYVILQSPFTSAADVGVHRYGSCGAVLRRTSSAGFAHRQDQAPILICMALATTSCRSRWQSDSMDDQRAEAVRAVAGVGTRLRVAGRRAASSHRPAVTHVPAAW